MTERNLILPGHPRYQPRGLVDIFGYDNLYRCVAEVELANLDVLADIGKISKAAIGALTPEIRQMIIDLPTSQIDKVEREITKHDIRAWVRCAQEVISANCGQQAQELNRWVHVPLTSYDALDTARVLQYKRAYELALAPAIVEVVEMFAKLVRQFADTPMIGRTHGQHALPITVGFWLATILDRIVENACRMRNNHLYLSGKISGAVGAFNAQFAAGLECVRTGLPPAINENIENSRYENRLLCKLGLQPVRISTQILPPEPLAYFLFSAAMLSATLAQFGRDCRHLMRTEIGEIQESFGVHQVGSSTMAHKRNPINFENLEGMWLRTKNEFGKVLDTLISEHQRDLVGSSVARDFPIILINLAQQLDTLRRGKAGERFLERLTVNAEALERNIKLQGHLIMAEPLYIALQMAGFEGDAHELVNRQLVPEAQKTGKPLMTVLLERQDSSALEKAVGRIPRELVLTMMQPETYTGLARKKALEIAKLAEAFIADYEHDSRRES